jgi:hypothetical protein
MIQRRQLLGACAAGALVTPFAAQANPGMRWEHRPGKASQIAVGKNGQVWVLGMGQVAGGNTLHRREGSRWPTIPAGLISIAVDAEGKPWGTNDNNYIYRHDGSAWQHLPGRAVHLAIGAKGTVFCIGIPAANANIPDGDVFEFSGSNWTHIKGAKGSRIAVDANDLPWVVTSSNQIWRHDGGRWQRMPGAAHDIGIGADGTPWVIGIDARGHLGSGIYRWDGRAWGRVDGIGTYIAVGPRGLPWVINGNADIFERV